MNNEPDGPNEWDEREREREREREIERENHRRGKRRYKWKENPDG